MIRGWIKWLLKPSAIDVLRDEIMSGKYERRIPPKESEGRMVMSASFPPFAMWVYD